MTTRLQGMRVPENPTSGPTAGWYPDPADAARERWWAGAEWTHDTRALPPVVAAPVAAPTHVDSSYSGASFGSSDFGSQTQSITATPNWSSSGVTMQTVEPTNGTATAGLILSILGFGLIGIILSVSGLKKAHEFESFGEVPVGRARSRWGVGLGLASIVLAVIVGVGWNQIYPRPLGNTELADAVSVADRPSTGPGSSIYNPDGSVAVYDREEVEQAFTAGFTNSAGTAPEALVCPESLDLVVGASIRCTFSFDGVAHVIDSTFTDSTGNISVMLDGAVVPLP